MNKSSTPPQPKKMQFYMFLLLVYCTVLSVFLFIMGAGMNAGSVYIWAKVASFAVLEYVCLLEVCYIFVVYIVSVTFIRSDVLRMRNRLRDVGQFIMQRRFVGAMQKERNNRMQHFNSACRVARIRPKYLISRLLVQLNDFDFPCTYHVEGI